MRDFNTSIYTKTVAITAEDFQLLDKIRGKKSKAGKLREIIEFYTKANAVDKILDNSY